MTGIGEKYNLNKDEATPSLTKYEVTDQNNLFFQIHYTFTRERKWII